MGIPLEMKLILVFGFIILASVLVAEANDINDEDVVVKDRTIRAAQNSGIGTNKGKRKTKGNGGNEMKTKKRKMKKSKFRKNGKINSGKRNNKIVKQNSKKASQKNKKRGNKFSKKDKKIIRKEKINKKKKSKQK